MKNQDSKAYKIDVRSIVADDFETMLGIINSAAEAYRGVIPPDRWHDPYMPANELESEMAAGVVFTGCAIDDRLIGVMGIQSRDNVDLIRHAYVLPYHQGSGVGSHLLRHLCEARDKPILIGTWKAAEWAVRFYERNGFARVADGDAAALLRTYWTVPERQIATSVVLASETLSSEATDALIKASRPPA